MAAFPEGSTPQAMGLRSMVIVAHIGDTINEYRLLCGRYFPEACPACGGIRLRRHGRYMHNAGDGDQVPISRFRCKRRGCCQVFTVLPDLFDLKQSLPAGSREQAVFQYAATRGTCRQVAQEAGVHSSTVWRWVERAAGAVVDWTAQLQCWLQSVRPGGYVAADVDESLRPRWYSRRLKRPDKVTRLLLLDRLPALVKRCRDTLAVAERSAGISAEVWAWPASSLAFCQLVLPGLAGNPGTAAHTEESTARLRIP